MPVNLRNLCVLTYAQGHTQWLYRSNEVDRDVLLTPDYWADALEMFLPGDVITIVHANFLCTSQHALWPNSVGDYLLRPVDTHSLCGGWGPAGHQNVSSRIAQGRGITASWNDPDAPQ